jgi:predicted DNA-binding transcriptional regulator AlpA
MGNSDGYRNDAAIENSACHEILLSPRQVAELIGIEKSTLSAWRRRGTGPPCYQIQGHLIRYEKAEVLGWLHSQACDTSANRPCAEATTLPSDDNLTKALAERIMGWRVGPDRFFMGSRKWLPRWKFQPLKRMDDAFRLLGQITSVEYTLRSAENGFVARVSFGDVEAEAHEATQARAISLAVARALGIEVSE